MVRRVPQLEARIHAHGLPHVLVQRTLRFGQRDGARLLVENVLDYVVQYFLALLVVDVLEASALAKFQRGGVGLYVHHVLLGLGFLVGSCGL